jgi:histidinol-phosphate aminotransferase
VLAKVSARRLSGLIQRTIPAHGQVSWATQLSAFCESLADPSSSAHQISKGLPMKAKLPVRAAILKRRTFEPTAEGRERKIRLDFNENTAGCSPAVRRALARLNAKQLAMYPEYQAAIRRLARYFRVGAEELLLANGADDALRAIFDTFVEGGSRILICEPTFPMYRFYGEIFGAHIDALRYTADMNFPLADAITALRKRPRVLFIANPNNPTGTLLQRPALQKILRAATHTAVVVDEAYGEFSGVTVAPWIRRYPQLFVVRTFAKAAGLAGLRLGAVIARADSLNYLRRAMPPFPVNVAALVAAEAAIRDRRTIRRYVREVKRLRKWLGRALGRLGVKTYPSAGNFLLADFGPPGPALFSKLEGQGILLRERSREIAPGFVRISIGTAGEMHALMDSICKEYKPKLT